MSVFGNVKIKLFRITKRTEKEVGWLKSSVGWSNIYKDGPKLRISFSSDDSDEVFEVRGNPADMIAFLEDALESAKQYDEKGMKKS